MLKQINPLKVSLHSIQRSLEITKTFYMLIFTNIISFLVLTGCSNLIFLRKNTQE